VVSHFSSLIAKDAFEDLNHIEHAHLDSALLAKLSPDAFQQRLTHFERPSRDRPLAFERRVPPLDQESAAARNHHASDAHDRAFRVLPGISNIRVVRRRKV